MMESICGTIGSKMMSLSIQCLHEVIVKPLLDYQASERYQTLSDYTVPAAHRQRSLSHP